MKRSLHSLVILATGAALLMASTGCERKQRTPANKSSAAAQGEKPGTGGAKTGTDTKTTNNDPAKDTKKPEVKVVEIKDAEGVKAAIAALSKQMKETGLQEIVLIKGTKNKEMLEAITNENTTLNKGLYEINKDGLLAQMDSMYVAAMKDLASNKADAADKEKNAQEAVKLAINSRVTALMGQMDALNKALEGKIENYSTKLADLEQTRLEELKSSMSDIIAIVKDYKPSDKAATDADAAGDDAPADSDLDAAAGADA